MYATPGRELPLLRVLEIPNDVRQHHLVISTSPPCMPLLTVFATGHRQRGQEYGYHSYVVLGLEEVDRQPHPHRHRGAPHTWANHPLPFFPASPSPSTLPAFVASSKLSFVPVFRSPRRTLSAHGTTRTRHALPHPQSLSRVSAEVWPTLRVFLEPMSLEGSSLGQCSSGSVTPLIAGSIIARTVPRYSVSSSSRAKEARQRCAQLHLSFCLYLGSSAAAAGRRALGAEHARRECKAERLTTVVLTEHTWSWIRMYREWSTNVPPNYRDEMTIL